MMNHRTVKRLIQLELQGDLLAQVDEFAAVLGSNRVSAIRKVLAIGFETIERNPSLSVLGHKPAGKAGGPAGAAAQMRA